MNRLVCCSALCVASLAWGADAFPWDGAVTLTDAKGQALTWTVRRVDGEVLISGKHPRWEVEHRAKPDGTPLVTVRRAGGLTTRVTYTATGADVERTDAKGVKTTVHITEKGLWDGDTLDARLPGLTWGKGRTARMRVVDVDKADGTVYPMVAEYAGEERCGELACHHVHLALDDFRRVFAPSYDYRFATTPGAKYLRFDGDGLTFVGR